MRKLLSGIGQALRLPGIVLALSMALVAAPAVAGNDFTRKIGDGYTIVKCSSPGECYFIISRQTDEVIGPLSEAALFRRSLSIFLRPFRGAAINPNIPAPVRRGLLLAPAVMALPYSLPALLLSNSL